MRGKAWTYVAVGRDRQYAAMVYKLPSRLSSILNDSQTKLKGCWAGINEAWAGMAWLSRLPSAAPGSLLPLAALPGRWLLLPSAALPPLPLPPSPSVAPAPLASHGTSMSKMGTGRRGLRFALALGAGGTSPACCSASCWPVEARVMRRAAAASPASPLLRQLEGRKRCGGKMSCCCCCACCARLELDLLLLALSALPGREEPWSPTAPVLLRLTRLRLPLRLDGRAGGAGSVAAAASSMPTAPASGAAARPLCCCVSCCCCWRRAGLPMPAGRRSHHRSLLGLASAPGAPGAAAACPPSFTALSPPSAATRAAFHSASSLAVHRLCPSGITTSTGGRGGSASSSTDKLRVGRGRVGGLEGVNAGRERRGQALAWAQGCAHHACMTTVPEHATSAAWSCHPLLLPSSALTCLAPNRWQPEPCGWRCLGGVYAESRSSVGRGTGWRAPG